MDALRNSKKISLLAVAILFLFTFFNLILDALIYMYAQKTFFLRYRLQRLSFFSVVAYSIKKSLALKKCNFQKNFWRLFGSIIKKSLEL